MRAGTVILALAGCLAPLAAARANDCQAVADAYDALSKSPAYHQITSMAGSELLDAIIVGDDMYVRDGATWKKRPLGPGMRVTMQKRVIPNAASLKDCRRVGTEAFQGKDAVVYDYTPPPMNGTGAMDPQRVWIAVESGLPIRMTSAQQQTDVTIRFDNVVAPGP